MKATYTAVIAEDEVTVATTLKQLLEQSGHRVLGMASTAEELVRMVAQLKPDVVVLDIQLGGSDGLEAARALMENCPTPIVVCTAYADSILFARAARAGVSAYLVKPFGLAQLVAAIAVSHERFSYWCCDRPKKTGDAQSETT